MSRIMIVNPLSVQKFAAKGKPQPVAGEANIHGDHRRAYPSDVVSSMNRPTPDPSQEGSRRSSAPCQFRSWYRVGSWSQCITKHRGGSPRIDFLAQPRIISPDPFGQRYCETPVLRYELVGPVVFRRSFVGTRIAKIHPCEHPAEALRASFGWSAQIQAKAVLRFPPCRHRPSGVRILAGTFAGHH